MHQIVLVCGGRDYKNWTDLEKVLDAAHFANPIKLLLHGGATGADELAGRWAGLVGVPVNIYAADWDAFRKAAGPKRNQRMLDEGKPDMVIAFPGGAGTADMVRRADKAKVPVVKITR